MKQIPLIPAAALPEAAAILAILVIHLTAATRMEIVRKGRRGRNHADSGKFFITSKKAITAFWGRLWPFLSIVFFLQETLFYLLKSAFIAAIRFSSEKIFATCNPMIFAPVSIHS